MRKKEERSQKGSEEEEGEEEEVPPGCGSCKYAGIEFAYILPTFIVHMKRRVGYKDEGSRIRRGSQRGVYSAVAVIPGVSCLCVAEWLLPQW